MRIAGEQHAAAHGQHGLHLLHDALLQRLRGRVRQSARDKIVLIIHYH